MFAREARLGWDSWGDEAFEHVLAGFVTPRLDPGSHLLRKKMDARVTPAHDERTKTREFTHDNQV